MGKPFYKDGLRFECTRCNACCRYEPGYVFLSDRDIARLLVATGLDRDAFIEKYCRVVEIGAARMLSLKEKDNYDCIFWDNGCTVYRHRPLQCRSFPFWSANLESREAWNEMSRSCPGANRGKLHARDDIEKWLDARREDPPLLL
jgi:uncharacterized protein